MAARIGAAWQDRWEREGTFHAPNPTGSLADGFGHVADAPHRFLPAWPELSEVERRRVIDGHRLAYRAERS